jgi:hypothetical protein
MAAILPLVLPAAMELLKRFIPDQKEQKEAEIKMREILLAADKARYEFQAKQAEAEASITQSAASTIKAESESESWMARNWRPALMFLIMALLGYNFMLAPIIQSLGIKLLITPLPNDMWTLLTISVGGYVAGRSGERMMGLYSDAKQGAAQANAQAEVTKFNSEKYFQIIHKMFPKGMSQAQVDLLNQAKDEALKG